MSELIHNSQHHRNLDTAQVSVYFQEIVDKVRRLASHPVHACSMRGQYMQTLWRPELSCAHRRKEVSPKQLG